MGESFAPVLSSGTATYTVPVSVPPGRVGVAPELALSYASTNGNGLLGIGWSFGVPAISRQTDEGTPRYDDHARWQLGEDHFIFNGGQELVPVDTDAMALVDASGRYGTATATLPPEVLGSATRPRWQQYRAKLEGAFMRFFRSPDGKRWIVQSLDGTRYDFGLLPAGDGPPGLGSIAAVQSERAGGDGRVFTWMLTRTSDAHGSTVYYQYTEDGTARYLTNLYYVSPAACASNGATVAAIRSCTAPLSDYGVRISFAYEDRPDAFTSYVSGWGIALRRRLATITSFAADMARGARYFVRRYHLAYNTTSFHTLLSSVAIEGRREAALGATGVSTYAPTLESATPTNLGGRRLPPITFHYSTMPSTSAVVGFGGLDSTVHAIENSPPVSLDAPLVDLFDVNGDGLDDVLVTDGARYRTPNGQAGVGVFWNGFTGPSASPAGRAAVFSAATVVRLEAGAEAFLRYSNPNLLGMDVDGDGRGDFLHLPPTLGHGWITPARLSADPAPSPVAQQWAFVHTPRPVAAADDPQIRLAQDGDFYRVLDVNNDHLIDIVRTTGTNMQTWMNLGFVEGGEGRFGHAELRDGAWTALATPIVTCLPHDGQPLDFGNREVRIGDMNGDGLADLVRLRQGRITYWPGRGGPVWGEGPASCESGFAGDRHIEMATAPRTLNPELAGVYFHDVDGDGADDVVQVRYHELDVWFNRAGHGFTERTTIAAPYAPDFAPNLRFVDIDGSGTVDLLYGRANQWQYLDLLGGQRPRVLTRVNNGLGATTALEYGSSTEDYVRDLVDAAECSDPSCDRFTWDSVRHADECDSVIDAYTGRCVYRSGGSPVVSSVVRRMQTTDNFASLSGTSHVATQEYVYHDGYYEGIEQEFRGFGAAEVHNVGDATVAGQWTRSYFHQGRRPNAIATRRLAQNPEEALRGSAFLTEEYDEGGRFVATTNNSFTLRELAVGLDGRSIAFVFSGQSDRFLYDTTTYQPQTTTVALPAFRHEVASASGVGSGTEIEETRDVRVRADRYVWTRSTTEEVDNLGRPRTTRAFGRLHDEDDGAAPIPVAYHETIAQRSESAFVVGAADGWLLRPTASFTFDPDAPDLHLGEAQFAHNATGDLTTTTQVVPDATSLDFSPSYAYGGASQTMISSIRYDALGGAVERCAGADISGGGSAAGCLRHSSIVLDAEYGQLAIVESVSVGRAESGTGFVDLRTSATWDRGRGAILSVTDANDGVSTYEYDGFGRIVATNLPDVYGCNTGGAPETLVRYVMADESGGPVNYIETLTDSRDVSVGASACASPRIHRARVYIDGLSRSRAVVSFAPEDHPSAVIVSGLRRYDARGNIRTAYDPRLVPAEGELSPAEVLRPDETLRSALAQYDTFGRLVAAQSQDGSISRTVYHASSVLAFDPNDDPQQNLGAPQDWGTPKLSRTDGHGRMIESVEMLRGPGELSGEARYLHVVSRYRADGHVLDVVRAQTASSAPLAPRELGDSGNDLWVKRTFQYDVAGRRVVTTDPDSDSTTGSADAGRRHWRYLFNELSELVAVRDPRGCGQDFFYDLGGRLVGEDYIACDEAQPVAESSVDSVANVMGLHANTSRAVDARTYYDAIPSWAPSLPSSVAPGLATRSVGRPTARVDRAQRSVTGWDIRGNSIWTSRQLAVIPEAPPIAQFRTGEALPVDIADGPVALAEPLYDPYVYVAEARFDGADRPYLSKLPSDPDWVAMGGSAGGAPSIEGLLELDDLGRTNAAYVRIGGQLRTVTASTTYDAWGSPTEVRYRSTSAADGITESFTYDALHRPLSVRVERGTSSGVADGTVSSHGLNAVRVPFHEAYEWDRANNLTRVTSLAGPDVFPSQHRQTRKTIDHDSMYRVAHVTFEYLQDDYTWGAHDDASDYRDERTATHTDATGAVVPRTNADASTHEAADPMSSTPAPMLPPMPESRLGDLTYSYDWMANQTVWEDDARSFYERSIGEIANGADHASGRGANPTLRPSALYVASNLPRSESEALESNDGWLDVDYGAGGNVVAMTARARCTDANAGNQCVDDPTLDPETRETQLRQRCACAFEQRFEYRWDELNRITEARRYDRHDGGAWTLEARQRTRYDAANQRIVKESVDPHHPDPSLRERTHLYVLPGDFDRVGVQVDRSGAQPRYRGSIALGTEAEYHIAGAVLVHRPGPATNVNGVERRQRLTLPLRDQIGTAGAVVDLESGHLFELSTFTPNGARETHWTTDEVSVAPNRLGFTGKEEDEEVGITYFGQRYLIARIGRWASPDPLAIHALGGGESNNAYHYVNGNLLQARDPNGLDPPAGALPTPPRGTAPFQVGENRWTGTHWVCAPPPTPPPPPDPNAGNLVADADGNGRIVRTRDLESFRRQQRAIVSLRVLDNGANSSVAAVIGIVGMARGDSMEDIARAQAPAVVIEGALQTAAVLPGGRRPGAIEVPEARTTEFAPETTITVTPTATQPVVEAPPATAPAPLAAEPPAAPATPAAPTINLRTTGRTAEEAAAIREYARRTNEWIAAQPGGRVTIQPTQGALRQAATSAARAERARAEAAGEPYPGDSQAGHVPDTAITGMANPPGGWLAMPGGSNQVAGGSLGSRVGQEISGFTVDGAPP